MMDRVTVEGGRQDQYLEDRQDTQKRIAHGKVEGDLGSHQILGSCQLHCNWEGGPWWIRDSRGQVLVWATHGIQSHGTLQWHRMHKNKMSTYIHIYMHPCTQLTVMGAVGAVGLAIVGGAGGGTCCTGIFSCGRFSRLFGWSLTLFVCLQALLHAERQEIHFL